MAYVCKTYQIMQPTMNTNTFTDYKCKYLCVYFVVYIVWKIRSTQ